jgi:FixJ family two-component response regulator
MSRDPPLVAVVDDDEAILRALSRLLRTSGVNSVSFSSGRQFLDSLPERSPDCVVLDFQMPSLSGLDVLKEMRLKGLDLPVIIITAHDDPIVRANCLAAGARAYLAKPIDGSALNRAIAAAVG